MQCCVGSRHAIMQRSAVVIEGEMNRAVARTNPNHGDIVRVVSFEMIIRKSNDFPIWRVEFSPCDAEFAFRIVISRVLPAIETRQRVLLESLSVDAFSPSAFRKVERV